MKGRPLLLVVATAMVLAGAAPAAAQTSSATAGVWWRSWSPLIPVADLARPQAPRPMFPRLFVPPAPRVGLHWNAGNPGAIPEDIEDTRTEFLARHTNESGEYSRPLDPGSKRSLVASASGWTPLGSSGGVIGGVTVEWASLGSSLAGLTEPHSMSPHFFADTSGAVLGHTLARLEGAGGWNRGSWGLGLGLGYESWDTQTDQALVPRYQRGSRSGASIGFTRRLGPRGFTVGVQGRWHSEVQSLFLSTRAAGTTVYEFEGYGEPVVRPMMPTKDSYRRRVEREGGAVGLSGTLEAGGLQWVMFGELTKMGEKQSEQLVNDPPSDDWDANGRALGIAAEGEGLGGRGRLVAEVRWTQVSGEATRAGLEEEGILFEATEEALAATLDLRYAPTPRWETGARIEVSRTDRSRRDLLAQVRSSLQSWRPALAIEAGRGIGCKGTVSLGVGAAWETPVGGIPNATALGDGYRRWLAPELAYYATPSWTRSVLLTGRWGPVRDGFLSLEVRYDRSTAREAPVAFASAPEGSRGVWNVAVRWVR